MVVTQEPLVDTCGEGSCQTEEEGLKGNTSRGVSWDSGKVLTAYSEGSGRGENWCMGRDLIAYGERLLASGKDVLANR